MAEFFLELINMSITATYLALAIIMLRFVLKKAPKWIMGMLWGFLSFRLVCPHTIESVFSIIPSSKTLPEKIITGPSISINSGITPIDNTVNNALGSNYFEGVTVPVATGKNLTEIFCILWITGIAAMLIYSTVSVIILKRKTNEAFYLSGNVYACDNISSPFILGVIKPKIYLPSALAAEDSEFVLAHENAHIKRFDHITKPIAFLLLSLYWFNPVMWLCYVLFCRDTELACDEKVIKQYGNEIKKEYSTALVNCSTKQKIFSASPLAFGEIGVKERVKNVLKYKKPAFWVIIISVAVCIAAALLLLTNPLGSSINEDLEQFIGLQVSQHYKTEETARNFPVHDLKILKTEKSGNETTVYMVVLYEEYYFDKEIKIARGFQVPAIITVKNDNESYSLVSYKEISDGSAREEELKELFPKSVQKKAIEAYKYLGEQIDNNLNKAKQLFNFTPKQLMTTDELIAYTKSRLDEINIKYTESDDYDSILNKNSKKLIIDDYNMLTFYDFDNDDDALECINNISLDGSGITIKKGLLEEHKDVDWVAPPSWYLNNRTVILFVGENENALKLLDELFNDPFRG